MKIRDKALVLYQNLTPLHMGTGSEIGFVDLPIQREKTTGLPKGEASGIKGVFRSDSKHKEWFGKEISEEDESGQGNDMGTDSVGSSYSIGNFCFTDARLLFFPVREYGGHMFVWVTCPFVLSRFYDEIKDFNAFNKSNLRTNRNSLPDNKTAYLLCGKTNVKRLALEDFDFNVKVSSGWSFDARLMDKQGAKEIEDKIQSDLYLISDTMFSYFCEMSTDIQTRIRIGENGVVDTGALFEEEFLPEYSILYNLVKQLAVPGDDNVSLEEMLKEPGGSLLLGGGTTLGKGITRFWYKINNTQMRGE